MILATEEVRWFFEGVIPPLVEAWFEDNICAESAQPARIDYYLRLNEGDSLGIKLREGRIEAKQREGEVLPVQLSERALGRVESWCKWSFDLAETEVSVAEAAQWVGVEKARRWCLFAVGENGRITSAPSDTVLERGCACELTEVRQIDTAELWWSLGFEAFGGTAVDRRDQLRHAARHFLGQGNGPLLPVEQSYSYPKWLQIVN
jgi:hypothetical protein